MDSASQWACLPILQPHISIQSILPSPPPHPGLAAALSAADVCSSPYNQPPVYILKAAIQLRRERHSWIIMAFLSSTAEQGVCGCEKLQQRIGDTEMGF